MFGIFNMTGEDSLNKKKSNTDNSSDSPCFGGLSSRFEYEQCKKRRTVSPTAALICTLMCVSFGAIGMCAGYILYDFVQANKTLYYPNGIAAEHHETIKIEPLSANAPMKRDDLEAVTEKQSKLYRIPRGVMVRTAKEAYSSLIIPGDIIVEVNGIEITEVEHLTAFDPDAGFTLRIFRQNKYIDITVSPENQ